MFFNYEYFSKAINDKAVTYRKLTEMRTYFSKSVYVADFVSISALFLANKGKIMRCCVLCGKRKIYKIKFMIDVNINTRIS